MRLELLLWLWSRPAGAYELSGYTWGWQSHPIEDAFWVDADSFPADEVSPEELQAAIDSAMQSWMVSGYDIQLQRVDATEAGEQVANGLFTVFHGEVPDMGGTLAYTAVWSYTDGEIFDCDLVFLDWDDEGEIVWSADPVGPAEGTFDVESVALHELGHCLGLGHSEDEDAIMVAKYSGRRALAADDLDGLAALFAPACVDGDGDGVTGCDGDCDDSNALVSPARAEVCDGQDDNCNGAIDEADDEVLVFGGDSSDADWSEQSVGNGFAVDHATTLRQVRQRWEGPAGARLMWSVWEHGAREGVWTLLRSAAGEAVDGEWQESPVLDLALAPGTEVAVMLGTVSDGVTMYYQKRPDLDSEGALTPLGSLSGRAIGDEVDEPDDRYLVYQELHLTAAEDPDTICTPEEDPDSGGPDSGAPVEEETPKPGGGCASFSWAPVLLLAARSRAKAGPARPSPARRTAG